MPIPLSAIVTVLFLEFKLILIFKSVSPSNNFEFSIALNLSLSRASEELDTSSLKKNFFV